MSKKLFSQEWFKALFFIFFKDLLWSYTPLVVIVVWSSIALFFFPNVWGWLTLFGVIAIVVCFIVFAYISERRKS
ncbi:hypothetical protein CE143_19660 [Photorhabdus luminescens]|nr:hypothetical protein CE143_19660 [Photorhabdus luminescens]